MNASLSEIADLVGGIVEGDAGLKVTSLSPIDDIRTDSLVFAEGADNIKQGEESSAVAMLVSNTTEKGTKPIIRVHSPFKAFIKLMHHFYPEAAAKPGYHPTACIDPTVQIGTNVSIGPFVVIDAETKIGDNSVIKSHTHIGKNVSIGSDCVIHPHVTIYDNTQIESRVTVHASTVVGSDGFGYINEEGKHIKVPHAGNVILENDVEIGANSVIDRATLGSTVIGEGTKIDNLVQIAHSVKLGQHNIVCAFTGIAGSSSSGRHVIFAANVGVSDHVKIENNVILGARAGVPPKKVLKEGNIYLGNPARPKDKAIEQELSVTRIPILRKNLKELTDKVNKLSESIAQKLPEQV